MEIPRSLIGIPRARGAFAPFSPRERTSAERRRCQVEQLLLQRSSRRQRFLHDPRDVVAMLRQEEMFAGQQFDALHLLAELAPAFEQFDRGVVVGRAAEHAERYGMASAADSAPRAWEPAALPFRPGERIAAIDSVPRLRLLVAQRGDRFHLHRTARRDVGRDQHDQRDRHRHADGRDPIDQRADREHAREHEPREQRDTMPMPSPVASSRTPYPFVVP
jgi:hypothetical protein